MIAPPEFIQVRGEYASLIVAGLLLWVSAGPLSRLLGIERRGLVDLFWNGGVAFLVGGRLVYLFVESPTTLTDPFVVVRFQGGIEPLAGAAAAGVMVLWRARSFENRWAWLTAGAAGLGITTVGYDLACLLRDACFGATAPPPLGRLAARRGYAARGCVWRHDPRERASGTGDQRRARG